jgi:hypothetical protein
MIRQPSLSSRDVEVKSDAGVPPSDHTMDALQYLIAIVAIVVAVLLASVR